MRFVGLTGGIATGKSQASKLFGELGAHIIDADELAHRAIEPNGPAWAQIVGEFGENILRPDRTIDRAKLGAIVFRDEEKRRLLNSIVHPHVFAEAERIRRQIEEREPEAIVIFDAALLIETGAHELMDKVILVTAPRKTQLKRLVERDGLSPEEAERRIAAQMPLSQKRPFADYLLDGTLSIQELRQKVSGILIEFKQMA